jgi:hypothetical protein
MQTLILKMEDSYFFEILGKLLSDFVVFEISADEERVGLF